MRFERSNKYDIDDVNIKNALLRARVEKLESYLLDKFLFSNILCFVLGMGTFALFL